VFPSASNNTCYTYHRQLNFFFSTSAFSPIPRPPRPFRDNPSRTTSTSDPSPYTFRHSTLDAGVINRKNWVPFRLSILTSTLD
jgi:hypothetical protein